MANSTTNLDTISTSSSQPAISANEALDAMSPGSLFGRRASTCAALTWGYYGGTIVVDGSPTQVANGTVALTASVTQFIESTRAGVVSVNTGAAATPGRRVLYSVIAGASSVTSYTDYRAFTTPVYGRAVKALSDANYTLLLAEAACQGLEFTGTLSAQRNIVIPLGPWRYSMFNNTGGGFGLQFIGATGTGIVVAAGKTADVCSNATNILRLTADV